MFLFPLLASALLCRVPRQIIFCSSCCFMRYLYRTLTPSSRLEIATVVFSAPVDIHIRHKFWIILQQNSFSFLPPGFLPPGFHLLSTWVWFKRSWTSVTFPGPFSMFPEFDFIELRQSDSWTLQLSDSPILGFSRTFGLSDLRTLWLLDSPTLGWSLSLNFYGLHYSLLINGLFDSRTLRSSDSPLIADSPTFWLSDSQTLRKSVHSIFVLPTKYRLCYELQSEPFSLSLVITPIFGLSTVLLKMALSFH